MGAAFVTKHTTSAPEDANLHAESANPKSQGREILGEVSVPGRNDPAFGWVRTPQAQSGSRMKKDSVSAKLGVHYLAFTSGVPLFGCVNISLPHNWLLLQARQ